MLTLTKFRAFFRLFPNNSKVVTLPLQPVVVRQVVPCIYDRSARWAIACGCLYPDRIHEVKGWCIQYSQLYQDWEIRKQHKLGQKLNTNVGDAKTEPSGVHRL